VFGSDQKLRHLPFFHEIAGHDENEAEWRAATAGLLIVRLVDAWMEEGAHVVRDEWAIRSIQSAVDALEERNNLRGILSGILEVMVEARVPDVLLLAPRLMAYGQFLEYESDWGLASDVYETIIAHTHPNQESDVATHAHLRRGFCLRHLGDVSAAVAAYQQAEHIAEAANDMEGVLRARIGEAKTALAHGNYPRAEVILDEAISRAAALNLVDVQSRALHDRSTVAGERGDYELAIKMAYEALEISQSPRERDRILGDIAASFHHLGVRSAARDAYLILAATAQEQYGRWVAALNLMELAADEADEVMFEQYRRTITVSELPSNLLVHYWLNSAKGLESFGRADEARLVLERAIALAQEHALNQLLFEAERTLKGLGQPSRASVAEPEMENLELEQIARRISAERRRVSV
jgi:tetratricopeptide (TPR) repeat protein